MTSVKLNGWISGMSGIVCAAVLASCAGPETQRTGVGAGPEYADPSARVVASGDADRFARYGRVSRIDDVAAERRTSGAGALIGGVLGAVVGNQIGAGTGRTAATVAGAVGGAVVGNSIEKNQKQPEIAAYDVHVRLDDGESRVITVSQLGGLTVGERVRIEGSNIVRL
jgi:outer membrane lipoprotein SlyB